MMNKDVRVLVVDDNAIMRLGLVEAISIEPGLQAIGSAANGAEALEKYRELKPDVVTMDFQMPEMNGLEATQKIVDEFPEARIILLTVFDSEEDIWKAVQAGVMGYLTKRTGEADVVMEAIREVAEDKEYFPPVIAQKLEQRSKQEDLSARELEVLTLLAGGRSNQEIADALDLTLPTVKFHIQRIRLKLRAVDRTQAVVVAYKKGILHLDE